MTAVGLLSSVTEFAMSLLIIKLNSLPLTYIYIPNMLLCFYCVIEKLSFHISCDISQCYAAICYDNSTMFSNSPSVVLLFTIGFPFIETCVPANSLYSSLLFVVSCSR